MVGEGGGREVEAERGGGREGEGGRDGRWQFMVNAYKVVIYVLNVHRDPSPFKTRVWGNAPGPEHFLKCVSSDPHSKGLS